jgi:hypothetical protein
MLTSPKDDGFGCKIKSLINSFNGDTSLKEFETMIANNLSYNDIGTVGRLIYYASIDEFLTLICLEHRIVLICGVGLKVPVVHNMLIESKVFSRSLNNILYMLQLKYLKRMLYYNATPIGVLGAQFIIFTQRKRLYSQ